MRPVRSHLKLYNRRKRGTDLEQTHTASSTEAKVQGTLSLSNSMTKLRSSVTPVRPAGQRSTFYSPERLRLKEDRLQKEDRSQKERRKRQVATLFDQPKREAQAELSSRQAIL